MLFTKKTFAVAGVFATLAMASPNPRPQIPADITPALSLPDSIPIPTQAIGSLLSELGSDPAVTSAFGQIESFIGGAIPTSGLGEIESFLGGSIPTTLPLSLDPGVLSSIIQLESTASVPNISATPTAARTSAQATTKASSQTSSPTINAGTRPADNAMMGASVGIIAGFVGAVALL